MHRDRIEPARVLGFLAILGFSVAVHVVGYDLFQAWLALQDRALDAPPVRVTMIDGDVTEQMPPEQREALRRLEATLAPPPDAPEDTPPPTPPPEPLPSGQVVEIAPPETERAPVRAEYLAEHDAAVKEETRTERVKVNPDVLTNRYSEDSKLALEERIDVGATEMSTGATPGSLSTPAPGAGAPSSAVVSPWTRTNKEGLAAPVPASTSTQDIAGAPQNDRLAEQRGEVLALNTRAFVGAAYINRIKRQVNAHWTMELDNLSPSTRLARPRYETVVAIVLDGQGSLEHIEVTDPSGSPELDACVVKAFQLAGPFPNPPSQLIGADGKIRLDRLAFEVVLGRAKMQYGGIDPRAGVQFPGIQKSPR